MSNVETMSQEERRSQVRKAAVAATIGTAIEWYDYFLYGTMAALVFPSLFFPKSDHYVGTLEAFATMFLGFVARPVGAFIFGHYGDRLGRKATLIVTLLLMGLSSTLIGCMPSYAVLGSAAPWILTLLRVLQGLGVGGEWGGSVLMSMEWGHQKRRGLMGSWPQLGVPLGLLFSSLFTSIFLAIAGKQGFNVWGWRIPFILSLVLVVIGLFIRLRVLETPQFQKVVVEKTAAKLPAIEVIAKNWKEIVLSALLRMAEQAPFYIFITFVLSYGTKIGYERSFLTNATTVAAVLSLISVPLFGHLSDLYGRKRIYALGAVFTLVWAFPYYGLINTKVAALAFIAIIISLIPHDMLYGPQAALIAENFPARLRYSGASLGYQLASVIAGGPAPLIATWLFHKYGSSSAVSVYIIFNAVVTLIAVALLKGRSEQEIVQEYHDAGTSVNA